MSLLQDLTFLELTTYQGRRRKYVKDTEGVFMNDWRNSVSYELFDIEETSLQPLNGRTLQAMAEGYRSRARYQFWTKTPIKGLTENKDDLPDQINIDGEWFSIYTLRDWKRTSFLPHYHCIVLKETANNSWDQENTTGGNYG